jgi:hypothetical protein
VGPLSQTDINGFNSTFLGWVGELNRIGATPPSQADFERTSFPFGNGRITNADAIWIFRKAIFNLGDPATTLNPSLGGTSPLPGF